MSGLLAALLLVAAPQEAAPATGLDGAYDPQNPFARIMRGELPVSKVYEDRHVLAFTPRDWSSPGHVLVIPKRTGIRNLLAMTRKEMRQVMEVVQLVAIAQRKALNSTGFQLIQNNGVSSFQHVYHPHFHVIPSFENRENLESDYRPNVPRAEQDAMAARLRAAWPEGRAR